MVDKVALGKVFPEFGFILAVSFHHVSILIHHLGDEQETWWPQFRDIVSPHRHKQKVSYISCVYIISRRLKLNVRAVLMQKLVHNLAGSFVGRGRFETECMPGD
jgi:hypothetical protein